MKNKLIIFVLALITFGCCELFTYNTYYKLPQKYKTELSELDTLIFENEEMQKDSFIVKNIIKGNEKLALSGTSGKEPYAFHEFEYIMINKINDSISSSDYDIMISQEDDNYGEGTNDLFTGSNSLIIGIIVGTQKIWEVTYEHEQKNYDPLINWYKQKYFEIVQTHKTMSIGNKEYSDILELSFDSGIKSIFYDYKNGIVKYIDSDDCIWIRTN